MADKIGSDLLFAIGECGEEVAFRMALVCKGWREAIEEGYYPIRDRILSIGETCLMQDLVSCLRLSPDKVKKVEYKKKRRWGGGHYNIFDHSAAVKLFHLNGGWDGVVKRHAKYTARGKRGA